MKLIFQGKVEYFSYNGELLRRVRDRGGSISWWKKEIDVPLSYEEIVWLQVSEKSHNELESNYMDYE